MSDIKTKKDSDMNLIIWMVVVPVAVDLFTTNSITWSRWAIFGFLIIYLLRLTKENKVDVQAVTILKERYAKGELTEEEYIKIKSELEAEQAVGGQASGNKILGYALIFLGVVFVLRNFLFGVNLPYFMYNIPWFPLILIGIGVYWVYRNIK